LTSPTHNSQRRFKAQCVLQGSLTITEETQLYFAAPVVNSVTDEVVSTNAPTSAPTVSVDDDSSSPAACNAHAGSGSFLWLLLAAATAALVAC
jgi:hypothetical protein